METIKVKVTRHGNRKYMVMYYDDPTTGVREQRSTKQTRRREAERTAAKWEAELREGRYRRDSRMTWEAFRDRYDTEKLVMQSNAMQHASDTAFNHLERIINPKRLSSLTEDTLSRFQVELRKSGLSETTVVTYLNHVIAALSWAWRPMKLINEVPRVTMPKSAKGRRMMRGRPITEEEFDRMIVAVPHIRPRDASVWTHYLTGLWLSGLRMEESTIVSWDADEAFTLDMGGRHPRFRIYAEAHKARRDQYLPITPDFAQFILERPEGQRHGRLFKINCLSSGKPIAGGYVSKIVSDIGRRAGVVVDKAAGKYATAHDLRRSFGNRWAKRVSTAVLKTLMRHTDIQTTQKYYLDLDAGEISDQLWQNHGTVGTLVGTSPKPPHSRGVQDSAVEEAIR